MTQKSLTCDCLYFHFEVCFQLTNDGLNSIFLLPNFWNVTLFIKSTLIFCYYGLTPCFKRLIFNFFFSRSKDFSRVFSFLLELSSTWSTKSFACLAVFRLYETAKYDALDFPCEVKLRVRTEGWEWTEVREWTERFYFELLFL